MASWDLFMLLMMDGVVILLLKASKLILTLKPIVGLVISYVGDRCSRYWGRYILKCFLGLSIDPWSRFGKPRCQGIPREERIPQSPPLDIQEQPQQILLVWKKLIYTLLIFRLIYQNCAKSELIFAIIKVKSLYHLFCSFVLYLEWPFIQSYWIFGVIRC